MIRNGDDGIILGMAASVVHAEHVQIRCDACQAVASLCCRGRKAEEVVQLFRANGWHLEEAFTFPLRVRRAYCPSCCKTGLRG